MKQTRDRYISTYKYIFSFDTEDRKVRFNEALAVSKYECQRKYLLVAPNLNDIT